MRALTEFLLIQESESGVAYDKHGPACDQAGALSAQRHEMAVALQQLQSVATTTAQQFNDLLAKVHTHTLKFM